VPPRARPPARHGLSSRCCFHTGMAPAKRGA